MTQIFRWFFISKFYVFIYLFIFLGPHLWHMDVPRPGAKSELQLPAYATATAVLYSSLLERGQGLNPCPQRDYVGSLTPWPTTGTPDDFIKRLKVKYNFSFCCISQALPNILPILGYHLKSDHGSSCCGKTGLVASLQCQDDDSTPSLAQWVKTSGVA